MKRLEIVQAIADSLNARTYLEIGIAKGYNFWFINAKIKFGVDPEPQINPPLFHVIKRKVKKMLFFEKEVIFKMTSDEFFLKYPSLLNKYKIKVVFIDGLHTYNQSLKDVLNCLKYLDKNGIILMHDCSPTSELKGYPAASIEDMKKLNFPDYDGAWSGDVWKTIVNLRSLRNDLKVFVINDATGIGVITKGKPENMLSYSESEINKMTYKDLELNRKSLLNIKHSDYFYAFLSDLTVNKNTGRPS